MPTENYVSSPRKKKHKRTTKEWSKVRERYSHPLIHNIQDVTFMTSLGFNALNKEVKLHFYRQLALFNMINPPDNGSGSSLLGIINIGEDSVFWEFDALYADNGVVDFDNLNEIRYILSVELVSEIW